MKAGSANGTSAPPEPVRSAAARLKRWFFEHALPIWWERGADLAGGGFFDRLGLDGRPANDPKRVRVQARQAHVYALAARLGWDGPAEAATHHGLTHLGSLRCADELYRPSPDAVGSLDGMGLLYDQAFALLGLAAGEGQYGLPLEDEARRLERRLADFAHRLGGYMDAPDTPVLLFANPNMHLFESFQAWAAISQDPLWGRLAGGQARLAMARLIDPNSGVLGEQYGADWSKPAQAAERLVWPGHLYEWAWLLLDWREADRISRDLALRLVDVAERTGVDGAGMAIFALDGALSPIDRGARLWSQTERVRACARVASLTGDGAMWDATAQACNALEAFLDVPQKGLWRDWRDATGRFREEAAPASSLYHIAGAIAELARVCGD